VPGLLPSAKRVVVGRAFSSDRMKRPTLPRRLALPAFAGDALSSLAYAPEQILLTLAAAGLSALTWSPWVGLGVVAVLLVLIPAIRLALIAFPGGGGDYEVVRGTLGRRASRLSGAALLIDHVLTVAVATSAAAHYVVTAFPSLGLREVPVALVLLAVLTLYALRGGRGSGRAAALAVYLFLGMLVVLVVAGGVQAALGTLGQAPSADLTVRPEEGTVEQLSQAAVVVLVLKAFTAGCVVLTGVEGIGTNVPSFRRPRVRNATTTLVAMGVILAVLTMGMLLLSRGTGVVLTPDPERLVRDGQALPADFRQAPLLHQLTEAVLGRSALPGFLLSLLAALVLMLAASTSYRGFPALTRELATDSFLPRQFRQRGDRLVYSNGIVALTAAAVVAVVLSGARTADLVQLYLVGFFVAVGLGQAGMVRHWTRRHARAVSVAERRTLAGRRALNLLGAVVVAAVLAVAVVVRFLDGAGLVVVLLALLWLGMGAIAGHYRRVREDLALDEHAAAEVLPSRSHALVLVSTIDKAVLLALNFAAASRPTRLEAIMVQVDKEDTAQLLQRWRELDVQIPLRVLWSPYRDLVPPLLRHVASIRRESERDVVVVYIPEFLTGRWWERYLHNRSAQRLRQALMRRPGVVVASVPWQLRPDPDTDLATAAGGRAPTPRGAKR
jgi:amino acid transporter